MSFTSDLVSQNFQNLLDGFEILKKCTNYWIARCPSCDKNELYIYENSTKIKCNRLNNCGYEITFYDFYGKEKFYEICYKNKHRFNENGTVEGKQYNTKFSTIKAVPGQSVASSNLSQQTNQYEIQRKLIPEEVFYNYHESLISHEGGQRYLDRRGVFKCAHLLGYDPKSNAIVFFHRDDIGQIIGITKRLISGQMRYKKEKGGSFNYPYLWEKAVNKSDKLYIVEGYFDALSLYQNGFRTIAIGSAILVEDKQKLVSKISKDIIFCCDNDSNSDILAKQIRRLDKLLFDRITFLNPESLKENKDMNDFFLTHKKDDFLNLEFRNIK